MLQQIKPKVIYNHHLKAANDNYNNYNEELTPNEERQLSLVINCTIKTILRERGGSK
jgi:hypothetical protein